MILDAIFPPTTLKAIPELARAAEAMGFGAAWVAETQHDPFLPGALIAEHTQRLQFGTAIAVGFARSPATMAYTAWDLAEASGGRFLLGLGTQVKAHIVRRFGMPWPESPVKKLREQILALRAFWQSWETGGPLNFRGEYYKLTLSSPFFTPGPIAHPNIPILIAGVNTGLAKLAGEAADGFHVHPFHSPRYLREVIFPAIEAGTKKTARTRADLQITVPAFAATNPEELEFVRQQIAFYASTPSYRPVMALHGEEETAQQLSRMAAKKQWADMPALITDNILANFATQADPGDLADALIERYTGLADRLMVYTPFSPGDRDDFWRGLVEGINEV